jgi:hypothetical protein
MAISKSNFQIIPWYWVEEYQVKEQSDSKWYIGFRDVTNTTNERTSIFSLVPQSGVGHTLPLVFCKSSIGSCLYFGNSNALCLDFIARQKVGGMHLTYGYLKQLAFLKADQYQKDSSLSVISKIMEITFTSWDIKHFADEVWKDADEELKAAIRMQWEENKAATRGHEWNPRNGVKSIRRDVTFPPSNGMKSAAHY